MAPSTLYKSTEPLGLVVRSATLADLPVLAEIERECFGDPRWNTADFRAYDCSVAIHTERVVGFLVSHTVFRGASEPSECEILNVAVLPVARRLGVATALLQTLFTPGWQYFLEVRESNLAARNLYEKLGFFAVGARPNYYANPTETAIVMRRK